MAKQAVDYEKLEQLNSDIKKQLATLESNIDDLKDAIKKMANGDGTIAYWSGSSAHDWYLKAFRNVANNYVRSARISERMRVVNAYAGKTAEKDMSKVENKNSKTYTKLRNHKTKIDKSIGAFVTLRSEYVDDAKKIVSGR